MSRFQSVDLAAHDLHVGRIVFLRAEVPTEPSPFALIRYSVSGEEQPRGLRLDMDKGAFLDSPEASEETEAFRKAAPDIVDALRKVLPVH